VPSGDWRLDVLLAIDNQAARNLRPVAAMFNYRAYQKTLRGFPIGIHPCKAERSLMCKGAVAMRISMGALAEF